jgi:DNA polymerase
MREGDELGFLAEQLRRHLGRRASAGVWRLPVPAAPTMAEVEDVVDVPDEAPVVARQPAGRDAAALAVIREDLGDCKRCKLHAGRKNLVFGVGNPAADLVFVGEGPGANEDAQGEPFVGEAGQLLNKMIAAMGWSRQDVYIANVVKCRPPGNRNPEPDEIRECEPFLIRQLGAIKPRMIVALGKFAAQCLTRNPDAPISALRGRFHEYQGIQVMPTFHPAYLLRTPSAKRTVWEDLQLVMAELDRLGVKAPRSPAAT